MICATEYLGLSRSTYGRDQASNPPPRSGIPCDARDREIPDPDAVLFCRIAVKRATDRAADRKAALAFEKEQKRREHERAKEEAAQRKERERRQKAVDAAQSAVDAARRKHEKNASDIQAQLDALEQRSQAEEARWEKEKARLEAALRRARG